jgi:predicted kinase
VVPALPEAVLRALILMAGMPGSGKSTIASGLGCTFGWPVIDKDVIATSLLESGISEDQMQPAAYEACFALVSDLLVRQQCSLILDTPAVYPVVLERALAICREADALLIPVLCSADRDTRNHRVNTRQAMRSQPAGQSRTPGHARERFAHLPDDRIEIVTDHEGEDAVHQAIAAVRLRLSTTE